MPEELEILFENDDILVVNKPSGISTQSPRRDRFVWKFGYAPGCKASVNADMIYWQSDPAGRAPEVYLGLPHRLDRPVSGVIVLAKTKRAAHKVSRQFERRQVRKLYWAAVEGMVKPAEGTWIDWLRKIPGEAQVEVAVHPIILKVQRAVLHYKTLGQTLHGSWLEIELETGRMHQIRIQTASRGWPMLGDTQYGSRQTFGPSTDDARQRAIALHARQLSFALPGTQEPTLSWRRCHSRGTHWGFARRSDFLD